jgi:uncharacterized protein
VTSLRMIKLFKEQELLAVNIEVANTIYKRFMGLMFRRSIPQNHGLLLTPCSSIHMFSMCFSIDAVFIAKDGTILHIERVMKPNRIGKSVKKSVSVLELNAGMAEQLGLTAGDILKVEYPDNSV